MIEEPNLKRRGWGRGGGGHFMTISFETILSVLVNFSNSESLPPLFLYISQNESTS